MSDPPTRLPDTEVVAKRDPPPATVSGTTEGPFFWLRKWKLTVSPQQRGDQTKTVKTIDLSPLRFTFTVSGSPYWTSKSLKCRVWNVPTDMAKSIANEYTSVTLEAGYQHGPYGQIFAGAIIFSEFGKESGTDTFLALEASVTPEGINGAPINTTLSPGYTDSTILDACLTALAPYGVTRGVIAKFLDDNGRPRGRALHGSVGDALRDLGKNQNAVASIDDAGKLNLVRAGESLTTGDQVVVLNSQHGMIGVAAQTLGGGIRATSLLNPMLVPNGRVHLDERETVQQTIPEDPTQSPFQVGDTFAKSQVIHTPLAANGIYVLMEVTHSGDTRGENWQTDIVTVQLNPQGQVQGPSLR